MTREELIHITDICFNVPVAVRRADEIRTYHEHECEEAKKIVLKMLEQEPCSDAISRQWLMRKAIERFYTTNYFNHITKMIEEAPSVTPKEPKTGEWIADVDGYTCSECGVFNTDDDNFCPNCGADMRGEEVDADSD